MAPTPTKRAVIDPLRRCNLQCNFCYYRYIDMESMVPLAEVKKAIDDAKARGNKHITVTGGEPTFYPEIVQLVQYARRLDLSVEIITNAIE